MKKLNDLKNKLSQLQDELETKDNNPIESNRIRREIEIVVKDIKKIKRVVFNSITKESILKAFENTRFIDEDLVSAYLARTSLDYLVGFNISPVLWRKVRPSLSAGRVQSVAVKLIVEREKEIIDFVSKSTYRVTAQFLSSQW